MFEISEEKNVHLNASEVSVMVTNEADTSATSIAKLGMFNQSLTEDEISESPKVTTAQHTENATEPQSAVIEPSVEVIQGKVKSRELKSLLDAAKESNLDTNIAYKRESRKSETFGVISSIIAKRRHSSSSNDSHQSNGKRNMRSLNPEFVQKHRKFLKTVTSGHQGDESELENMFDYEEKNEKDARRSKTPMRSKTPQRSKTPMRSKTPVNRPKTPTITKTPKRKRDSTCENIIGGASIEDKKSKKIPNLEGLTMKMDKDKFCWRCHREGIQIQCETCPRSYHVKCLKTQVPNTEHWPCPECLAIIRAESTKTRPPAMKDMTQEHLCELLKFAVKRMNSCQGSEPFIHPVDIKSFPDYRTYVIQPMDLTTLQNNIRENIYGSTVAFTADAKWILHNSIIFNSHQSKLTTAAKAIIKICKQEMSEIETCAECYLNANTKKNTWFVEVCTKPHMLLWAKLKGFPYWPAKSMKTDGSNVDVRFFGAHDRAWVPVRECFLYSKKDPNTTNKQKRSNIAECVKEVDVHIEKLKVKFGEFRHAAYRTFYNPNEELEQLALMLPKYKPNLNTLLKFPPKVDLDEKPMKKLIKSKLRIESESDEEYVPEVPINEVDGKTPLKRPRRSRVTSDASDEIENSAMTSSSKSSISSEDKAKLNLKFTITDFDKFVEGYGTEDEELVGELNIELRNKIAPAYASDTDDENCSPLYDSPGSKTKDIKNGDEENDEMDKSSVSSSDMSLINRGKVRTRGGYHNVSGKIKVITGRKSEDFDNGRKRSSEESLQNTAKLPRKDSEDSPKSDTGKICDLDKINKLEELPETFEVSIGNSIDINRPMNFNENSGDKINRPEFVSTLDKVELEKMKPVIQVDIGELYNTNTDYKISPPSKTESIADKLIKRMSLTQSDSENDKVETVKKQIFDSLEATSSTLNDTKKHNLNERENKHETNKIEKENLIKSTESTKDEKKENKTQMAAADSQNNLTSDEESDEDYLHLTTVRKSYGPSHKSINNKLVTIKHIDQSLKLNSTKYDDKQENTNKDVFAKNVEKNNEKIQELVKSIEKKINKNETAQIIQVIEHTDGEKSKTVTSSKESNQIETTSDDETSDDEENERGTIINPTTQRIQNSFLKIVNVGDIISGKINNIPVKQKIMIRKLEKKIEEPTSCSIPTTIKPTEPVHNIEIKPEPFSDLEENEISEHKEAEKTKENKMYDVTLSFIDRQKKKNSEEKVIEKSAFKVVDNLTKVIDSVATNSFNLNRKEISLRPLTNLQSPKQKARKTFPSVPGNKPIQTIQIKKIIQEKKDTTQTSVTKQQSVLQIKTIQQSPSIVTTASIANVNKDNLVYITQHHPNSVVLPPNQPISLAPNVSSPVLTMVQHPNLNNTNLIIHQNPPVTIPVTTPSVQPNVTQSTESVSSTLVSNPTIDILSEDVCRSVGDMLCKPPPKLKPKPPGPLSTYFDEGSPSSAGPVTKTINSVAHRLTDYFRGLLKETLHDLNVLGSPEAKIRSLELEIESLNHKHKEEMLEFRKNISTILKDIQKSIIEEKNKIIDETRATCEAERLRSVEEAKSKQWCAYCLKEAQFYCCWNTSYCDYPCQQKHWATHMKTCSQSTVRNPPTGANTNSAIDRTKPSSPAVFKAVTKQYTNTNKVINHARMFVKKSQIKPSSPMYIQRPVQIQASSLPGQSTLTLVESTPGNFEIVGNHGPISLDGKLIPATSIIGKVKTTTVTTSTIAGTNPSQPQKAIILSQKATPISKPSIINKEINSENKS